jgi:hypothetical protein
MNSGQFHDTLHDRLLLIARGYSRAIITMQFEDSEWFREALTLLNSCTPQTELLEKRLELIQHGVSAKNAQALSPNRLDDGIKFAQLSHRSKVINQKMLLLDKNFDIETICALPDDDEVLFNEAFKLLMSSDSRDLTWQQKLFLIKKYRLNYNIVADIPPNTLLRTLDYTMSIAADNLASARIKLFLHGLQPTHIAAINQEYLPTASAFLLGISADHPRIIDYLRLINRGVDVPTLQILAVNDQRFSEAMKLANNKSYQRATFIKRLSLLMHRFDFCKVRAETAAEIPELRLDQAGVLVSQINLSLVDERLQLLGKGVALVLLLQTSPNDIRSLYPIKNYPELIDFYNHYPLILLNILRILDIDHIVAVDTKHLHQLWSGIYSALTSHSLIEENIAIMQPDAIPFLFLTQSGSDLIKSALLTPETIGTCHQEKLAVLAANLETLGSLLTNGQLNQGNIRQMAATDLAKTFNKATHEARKVMLSLGTM